jgi:alkanesulfonate monooxygenase SsuD/methylene tetrahydromethanopterin reductase-like flavin-dependent oxidoreductase (luciferase family)
LKFGLAYNTAYYGADPDLMATAARHAEKATAGPVAFPPDLAVADPLECLAYVAAATSTLLLGTAVLLLPCHHPVVLAKQLATIDVLSRGRMSLLTVGLGVLPGGQAAAATATLPVAG